MKKEPECAQAPDWSRINPVLEEYYFVCDMRYSASDENLLEVQTTPLSDQTTHL